MVLAYSLRSLRMVDCVGSAYGRAYVTHQKNLAVNHFKSLGLRHKHIEAKNKNEIDEKHVIDEMSKANIVYFSGGNPQHLINSISVNSFLDELLRIKKTKRRICDHSF